VTWLEVIGRASQVPVALALLVTTVGILRALLAPARAAAVLAGAFSLTLEFLLAAGLIRLATRPGFTALGITAAIIVVRQVIGLGLRYARRGLDPETAVAGRGPG